MVATLFAFPLVFQRLFALESHNFNTIKPHQSATHPHCCNMCTYDYITHNLYLNRPNQMLQLTPQMGTVATVHGAVATFIKM